MNWFKWTNKSQEEIIRNAVKVSVTEKLIEYQEKVVELKQELIKKNDELLALGKLSKKLSVENDELSNKIKKNLEAEILLSCFKEIQEILKPESDKDKLMSMEGHRMVQMNQLNLLRQSASPPSGLSGLAHQLGGGAFR